MIKDGDIEYTPEEYASFWGCDNSYIKPPLKIGDGYLFYNFGSEKQERTKEWLTKFLGAIERMMQWLTQADNSVERENDLKGLGQLRDHVQELISEKEKEFLLKHKDTFLREMRHPKSQRVLDIQAGLKSGGCPAEALEEATMKALVEIESKNSP